MQHIEGREEVGVYFWRYEAAADWHLRLGVVDGRPAILVRTANDAPDYFIRIGWQGEQITTIRDYRYARYAAVGLQSV